MRIIAGEYRSRLIEGPPEDAPTRPMPDRVKESLFNILRGHFEGANVLDAFSGTGVIGLECASRGAARVVCVEKDRHAAAALQRNVDLLGCGDRVEVVRGDALGAGALARAPRPLTLAFFDPPYAMMEDRVQFGRVMDQVAKAVGLLSPDGFAVLRTPWPLTHVVGGPSPAAALPAPHRHKPRRDDWKRDVDAALRGERRRTHDPAEAVEEPLAQEEPVVRVPADLTLPNAVGPERHEYRGMCVHLYAKRR